MEKIAINSGKLYEGSILAAIVHAVTVGEFPELNYEHSWDGINYCMNNSCGCRGTITFDDNYIIAAFRDDRKLANVQDAISFFEGAEENVIKLAENETLQYLLDTVDGSVKPLITAAFWGNWEQLYSNQTLENLMRNGGYIIENQIMEYQDAMKNWNEEYEFHDGQEKLIDTLFQRRMKSSLIQEITISLEERNMLYGDRAECIKSLSELNIFV